jgi:peptidoglycan/LPS O-acetylase OafA/YrhL
MVAPIPALTGLRFAAALSVVLSHAIPKIAPFPHPPILVVLVSSLSAVGMTLFFVLSGFVIYYNYCDSVARPAGLYSFMVARLARLYPLYAVCVSYDLLMRFSYSQLPAAKLAALPYYATLTQSWVYHPAADQALIYQFGLVSSVSWSISTEWFFYLIFPLACLVIARLTTARQRIWAAAALAIVASWIMVTLILNAAPLTNFGVATFGPIAAIPQDSFYRWLIYFSPYTRLFEFLLGCLCAAIYLKLPASPSRAEARLGWRLTTGALLAIAVLQCLMFGSTSNSLWIGVTRGLHMNFGFAVPAAVLIFCCARYRNAITRMMGAPLVVLCGEASYSLYLLHLVIINAFRYEAATVTSARVMVGSVLQMVVVIAAAIGLSLVSWFLIEVPGRRWVRRAFSISPPRDTLEARRAIAEAPAR